MIMWTTLDGYTLRLPVMTPGRLRALMHQADLQDQIARYYRGDLRQAYRVILRLLARNASRVGALPDGRVVFAAPLGQKNYRIVTRSVITGPRGSRHHLIVSIRRSGYSPARTRVGQAELFGPKPPRPADPKNDEPRDPGFDGIRGMSIYTRRSEMSRYKDRAGKDEGHHALPQFIGGAYDQTTVKLEHNLHYLYHQELKEVLKLPTNPGFYARLSPAELRAVLRKVYEHAKQFDARYKTKVAPSLLEGLRVSRPIKLHLSGKIEAANAARRVEAAKKRAGRRPAASSKTAGAAKTRTAKTKLASARTARARVTTAAQAKSSRLRTAPVYRRAMFGRRKP